MNISVIVPAYNHLPEVMACLNSLRHFCQNRYDIEFLVQDDYSTEYSAEAVIPLEIAIPQRNPVNVGFGANCNAGAARARGDILLFVNQDVYGVPGWSDRWDVKLLAAFENPEVGIVGARLLYPNGSVQNAGGLYDAKCQPFHRCLGYSNPHVEEVATAQEVSWTTGAALAVRRELFDKVGGFDPAYVRGYFEDVDLCERVKGMGYGVWYEPAVTFIHMTGTTGGSPYFMHNAGVFFNRWVASGMLKPDVTAVKENWW